MGDPASDGLDTVLPNTLTDALTAIPNSVFEGVTVTTDTSTAGTILVTFTWAHNSGNIASLQWWSDARDQLTYNATCSGADGVVNFGGKELTSVTHGNKEES